MGTRALIRRRFVHDPMRGSVIRNAERTTNGTKQHYDPCVADDSARCVSYANVQPHHQVRSVYIVREVPPHHETGKKYIGAGRGATTRNKGSTHITQAYCPLTMPRMYCPSVVALPDASRGASVNCRRYAVGSRGTVHTVEGSARSMMCETFEYQLSCMQC
jgi:hypothetical protein